MSKYDIRRAVNSWGLDGWTVIYDSAAVGWAAVGRFYWTRWGAARYLKRLERQESERDEIPIWAKYP